MNQTHLHLLINHLPIIGSLLGGLVLVLAIWSKSRETKIAAFNILIISAIGAAIAYFTGEGAEETVEKMQGISKGMLDKHEDAALPAFIALGTMGVLSLVALILTIRNAALAGTAASVVLLVTIVGFGLVARAGYTGGQIRHTEISSTSAVSASGISGEKEGD